MIQIRPAASSLEIGEAMARVEQVATFQELLTYLQKHYDFWNPTAENVTVRPYCRDPRNGWDTHLICVDGKAALFSDGPISKM